MVDDGEIITRVGGRIRIAVSRICKKNTKYFCHLTYLLIFVVLQGCISSGENQTDESAANRRRAGTRVSIEGSVRRIPSTSQPSCPCRPASDSKANRSCRYAAKAAA